MYFKSWDELRGTITEILRKLITTFLKAVQSLQLVSTFRRDVIFYLSWSLQSIFEILESDAESHCIALLPDVKTNATSSS